MEPATQEFLEIKDIKEGVIILKNNNLRGILMVSSINFALKSNEEQTAIIYAFQNFLNSLDFSCQIIAQSRNINITPYLDSIKRLEEEQTNELLKTQISSYVEFIKELVKGENIMTKSFYVVVPYDVLAIGPVKFDFLKPSDKKESRQIKDEDFQRHKSQLWQRMEFLAVGLKRCELDVIPLTTPELVELFWSIHHPEQAEIGYSPQILPEMMR